MTAKFHIIFAQIMRINTSSPCQLERQPDELIKIRTAEEGGDDEIAEKAPREITLYRLERLFGIG